MTINQKAISKGFLISILIIIGVVIVPSLYFIQKELIQSNNWLATKGRIVAAKLDFSVKPFCYDPKVTYEYSINGISYSSSNIYIGPYLWCSLKKAHSVLNRYLVGKEVKVFYNPDNPSTAVLERHTFFCNETKQ